LVLHQRDQRRDDDGESVEEQRRQLVAQALATARGKHRERRAASEELRNHGLLSRPKGGEVEALAKKRAGGV
jgi:chromatin segregation and condensation protein Rec8/ScpA/Scc1 (kleisin family)